MNRMNEKKLKESFGPPTKKGMVGYRLLFKHAMVGAIGFAIGNIIISIPAIIYYGFKDVFDSGAFTIAGIVFCSLGSITWGILLGVVFKNIKQGLRLALAGLIWVIVGYLIYPFFMVVTLFDIYGVILAFVVMGVIGGVLFSVIAKRRIKPLILANVMGFIIAALVINYYVPFGGTSVLAYSLIVGAFLGIGMYFAEKNKVSKQQK